MSSTRKFLSRLLVLALLPLAGFFPSYPAHGQEPERVIFATRNIYLGADVGIAMKKLPNFPAAAQFMWDQVRANDFSQRAPLLAQELINTGAQVIGIQEATTWHCRTGLFSREVVVHDFLGDLIKELGSRGAKFSIAEVGQERALNPGFEIAPIPYLTMVEDRDRFPALFERSGQRVVLQSAMRC